MHYYKRNLGDYAKKAGRLSMLQHGAYNLLIDACYDREDFPTLEQAFDWAWASTPEEKESVEFVLSKFFVLENDKYIQKRIAEELDEYEQFKKKQAEKGKKGGRPKNPAGLNKNPAGLQETQREAGESRMKAGESLTTNQEPLTTNQDKSTLSAKPDLAPEFLIFDYWVSVMGMKPAATKFTDKRKRCVKARLRDGYTPDQIREAIDHCRGDPWSMGDNDRNRPFNDLELICRSGEKLESFLNMEPSHAANRPRKNPEGHGRKLTPAERVKQRHAERYGGEPGGGSSDTRSVVSIQ
jgi:uncharacterized protein YdaU (DUF1376 family)